MKCFVFQNLTKEVVHELIQEAQKNAKQLVHYKQYYKENYASLINNQPVDYFLTIGDRICLEMLPNALKEIEPAIKRQIKKIPRPKYVNKRKLSEVEDDEILATTYENEPPKKIQKVAGPEKLLECFNKFINKVLTSSTNNNLIIEPEQPDRYPKFKIGCGTCGKEVSVGYKLLKGGVPSFIKTNVLKHPCFKETSVSVVPPLTEVQLISLGDDSGIGI